MLTKHLSSAAKKVIMLCSLSSLSVFAYTDVEFAFKVAAERRVKEKITDFLTQSLPVEDFKLSVSTSVFALEPSSLDSTLPSFDMPNAFTEDDPQDLSLGVIQSRDMREALQGRDQLIEKLRKDLERAKAPLHQGVEILQMSVWLALKDSYSAQAVSKIREDLSAFVADTYRITPRVVLQQLKPGESMNDSEQMPQRSLASQEKSNTELPIWIYGLVALSVLLSIIALAGKSKTQISEKEVIHKLHAESEDRPEDDKVTDAEDSADDISLERSSEASDIPQAEFVDVNEKLHQTLDSLAAQLRVIKSKELIELVQFWAESGGHANHKVAVTLKTRSELKPESTLDCSLGSETLLAFTTWKDLSSLEQLRISSEALWELSAVASVGTKILGSKLSRLGNLHADKVKLLIEKVSKQEGLYMLWSILSDSQRQDVLKKISHQDRSKLFSALWSPNLGTISDDVLSEVEQIMDKVLSMNVSVKGTEPEVMRKSFILSLDVRSEVEILWPELKSQSNLVEEIKRDIFNLSTMAYVKDEFWTLQDLVPSEDEFVSMSKLLGKEASGYILAVMPSLTRHIYEGVLAIRLTDENLVINEEDYRHVESYISRVRGELKAQNMRVSDLMQSDAHWSLQNLGSMDESFGAGNEPEAA
jgi:hypothetical protein